MYDKCQHLDLFNGIGRYLFRGTLPSSSFGTAYRGSGVTPTSVDPIVSTLFACRYSMEGPAGVLIALKVEFAKSLDGPNFSSFWFELAVNLDLPPDEFEKRCIRRISLQDSLALLDKLGYRLPSRLPDLGALTQALMLSPRMTNEEIDCYVERCRQLPE